MIKEFKTDNLSLCPFLQMNGLKYLRADISLGRNDKSVVSFIFEDPRGIGRDLELDFTKSQFKQYRDIFFFFRGEIERLKRQLEQLNHLERERQDEKHIAEYEGKIKHG